MQCYSANYYAARNVIDHEQVSQGFYEIKNMQKYVGKGTPQDIVLDGK
jgi:hypothetical protein